MEFNEALNVVKQCVELPQGVQFDGLIVKKLTASNTLDDGRTTNQTHIAITGEQMNFFPAVMLEGYFGGDFNNADAELKKYFVVRVPVVISKKNLIDNDRVADFENDNLIVNVSVVRSRRSEGEDQIQLSLLSQDDIKFVEFRKQWHVNDYMVVLKEKGKLKYYWFGVSNNQSFASNLGVLNGKFYKLNTLTIVDSEHIVETDKNNIDNEQAFRDWMGQQKKDNGELYADATIDQECNELKNAKSKDLIKDFIPCENLFVIDDAESIDKVRKDLESKIAADELARNEADGLPNALNFYYKFLLWKHNRISFECKFSSNKPHNRIIFGAPGTGKSHKLEEERKALLDDSNGSYERVTFHPDYSYAQFIGTYKPVSYGDEDNKKIKYEFVPGPFTRVLVKALKNCIQVQNGGKAEPYLLIIEELNRAKTAAVFGDVFQLLDRKNGVSEYEIETSQDLREYLANELEVSKDSVATIKIPDNMFIWATMNSADQGVFPLDTAFKRRWSFEYLPIDCEGKDKNRLEFNIVSADGAGNNETIYWDELRRAINHHLSGNSINAREDKLLGSYYIQYDKREKEPSESDENYEFQYNKNCTSMFCDKVLMYLFEDVVKTHRDRLFATKEYNRFSEIRNDFIKNGVNVFVKAITDEYGELTKGYGKKDESKTE